MPQKKILILSRYGRKGASSRLRTFQYVPALEHSGFQVEVSPFFDDAYLEDLYAGRKSRAQALKYYAKRLKKLVFHSKPDVVWVEKEVFPWLPAVFEDLLFRLGVPVVADYDDAIFHRYDQSKHGLVRKTLGAKIDSVMHRSDTVTAGNAYLAQRATSAGAKNVVVIPTVLDTDRYELKEHEDHKGAVTIGWVGTPGTWKECVTPFLPVLSEAVDRSQAKVLAVGAGNVPLRNDAFQFFDWSEDREAQTIKSMDIGIMPLPDTPWMRGKCAYKLLQYMACGLPVVASPVGANKDVVEHGVNGFLADTEKEWRDALETLSASAELRSSFGHKGRLKVHQEFSLNAQSPRVVALFKTLVEPQGQR